MTNSFLYFSPSSEGVFRKAPKDDFESFVPTLDLDEGWLVFVEYTTYDSNGPQPGTHYEVIDIYPDAETARKAGSAIKLRSWSKNSFPTPPVKADGSKVYENWHHWGQRFQKAVMVKVTIQDEKPVTREEFS